MRSFPREKIFLRDTDSYFERSVECTIDGGLEYDNLSDPDRMVKMEFVNGSRHAHTIGMTGRRDCSSDVHHVHQPAAQEIAQTICIVRKNHLCHFHKRVFASPGVLVYRFHFA
jgi:hypothetical protein